MFHLNCLERGGAERVVSTLASTFAAEGDEVIVATEWQGEEEFQIDERISRLIVGPKTTDENKSRLVKAFLRIKYLREVIKLNKPDIVIAFGKSANYRLLNATVGLDIPKIIAVRCNPVGVYDRRLDKILGPLTWPRADGCVFQTVGQRDFFPDYLRKKSAIILNPINKKYIGIPRAEYPGKSVVYSGRLVDFKDQNRLIEAFIKVHAKHPEYDLRIYGGDSGDGTKELLESTIASNHAEEYVKLMGSSDNLESELGKGSLFAFSSWEEGLPNSVIEAMALGLPVVATDCPCGGPRTIIQDGVNGILVPILNTEALADGMCRLIENPEWAEILGKKAREIVNLTEEHIIVNQWREYIDEVISRRRR